MTGSRIKRWWQWHSGRGRPLAKVNCRSLPEGCRPEAVARDVSLAWAEAHFTVVRKNTQIRSFTGEGWLVTAGVIGKRRVAEKKAKIRD